MNNPFPSNVTGLNGAPVPELHSSRFISRVIESANEEFSAAGTSCRIVLFVAPNFSHRHPQPAFDPPNSPTALIVLADEREVFDPRLLPAGYTVFKAYSDATLKQGTANAFPVGYFDAVADAEGKEFSERSLDLAFTGYLNRNRVDLLKQFHPVPWLPERNIPGAAFREMARRIASKTIAARDFSHVYPASRIGFTDGFGKGLAPAEYARQLGDTRISICPPGFVSNETIRHWESMKLGCVIISAPLPPSRFYRGSPMIILEDWSRLRHVIDDLLDDPEELLVRHRAMVQWWNEICSERAAGSYLARTMIRQIHRAAS